MAIYHFSAQAIGRSSGRSATAAAAYRAGERIEDERTGEVHDYTRKGGVAMSGIMAPEHAQPWVFDRSQLWNTVEQTEKRKDSQLCREINAAIPRELRTKDQVIAVREFVQREFVDRGMVADVAFHDLRSDNPHCHIMLSMRHLEADGFGKKAREWNDTAMLRGWREQWSEHMNRALERAGHDVRIDHRSYADQGINQEPTMHTGPAVAAMEKRDPGSTRVGKLNQEVKQRNEERQQMQEVIDEAEADADALEALVFEIEAEATAEAWHIATTSPAPAPEAQRKKKQPEKPPEADSTRKPTPTLDDFENVLESPTEPEIDPNDLNARLHGPGYVPKAPEPEIDPNDLNARLHGPGYVPKAPEPEIDLPPPPEPEPDDDFGPSMG